MLMPTKRNDFALARRSSCCQRWHRRARVRRKSGGRRRRRRREAPLTAPDRKIDMESQHLTPPSYISLPPFLSPSISFSLSPSDGWPLQYIWLIFSADWVREHVKEWKGERGRRWRWRCWTGQPVWSPGTAAWTGSAVLQKWELDSLTWLDIKK